MTTEAAKAVPELVEQREPDFESEPDREYGIVQKQAEQRITTGVLYAPDALDHHDEYVEADDLEKAVHGYMAAGDFDIHRQHGDEVIGKSVGVIVWPFEEEVTFKKAADGSDARKMTLPAGTAYVSVKWTKDAWEDVKKDKITGLSMGGGAVRVRDAAKEGLRKFSKEV